MAKAAEHHGPDDYHRGEMEVGQHKATFAGFLAATAWGSALVVMGVALLVVAFAMGAGWFAGVAVWAIVGAGAGAFLRLGAAWWATLIVSTLAFIVGGGIVALIAAAVGA